eukprot:scaffold127766_cov60-Phaeocystis_antarctica.AAC.1
MRSLHRVSMDSSADGVRGLGAAFAARRPVRHEIPYGFTLCTRHGTSRRRAGDLDRLAGQQIYAAGVCCEHDQRGVARSGAGGAQHARGHGQADGHGGSKAGQA